MKLNFKPTKVPIYEIDDYAGINYPSKIGTRDSDVHYKATKNKVTFRVRKENMKAEFLDSGEVIIHEEYYLYIEYLKKIILRERVKSFNDGFNKANIWADKYLNDKEYLIELVSDIKRERCNKILEDEKVDTLDKAKTIKFPMFSKYSDKYIYDVMQKDLEHCIAYYAGNLNSKDFDFSSIDVAPLNYKESSERTKSYNCIKYLLDEFHPHISKDLLGYFKDINLSEAKEMTFSGGKYNNRKIDDIYKEDPSYIAWYLDNTKKTIYNIRLIKAIRLIIEDDFSQ